MFSRFLIFVFTNDTNFTNDFVLKPVFIVVQIGLLTRVLFDPVITGFTFIPIRVYI